MLCFRVLVIHSWVGISWVFHYVKVYRLDFFPNLTCLSGSATSKGPVAFLISSVDFTPVSCSSLKAVCLTSPSSLWSIFPIGKFRWSDAVFLKILHNAQKFSGARSQLQPFLPSVPISNVHVIVKISNFPNLSCYINNKKFINLLRKRLSLSSTLLNRHNFFLLWFFHNKIQPKSITFFITNQFFIS